MEYISKFNFFECLIMSLFLYNTIYMVVVDIELANKSLRNGQAKSKIEKFKTLYFIISYIFIMDVVRRFELAHTAFILFMLLYFLIKTMEHLKNKKIDFNQENVPVYVFSTVLYIVFFNPIITDAYIKVFSGCSHIVKEILFLVFLNLKILFCCFSLLINISVFFGFYKKDLKRWGENIALKKKTMQGKEYDAIIYKTPLYDKFKLKVWLAVDVIIYILTTPFCIVLTTLKYILVRSKYGIMVTVNWLLQKINKYYEESNIHVVKIIKIMTIFTLLLTNSIVVFQSNIFSEKLANTFGFISSVILIPLIYDQLKEMAE